MGKEFWMDAYSVLYHWADGVWYPYLPDLPVLPVIEYHWIVAFHSCHLPFQTPGIMNRCPTKRYLICIFKLLNCLLDFSRRFIITTCHGKTVGSEGKPAVHYSTWRDCNSELPGGVHKTNLCHHPPSWFNNVHKSWFKKKLFQWFHCDRIRLHSDLFLEAKVGNSPSVKGLSRVVNSIHTACSLS